MHRILSYVITSIFYWMTIFFLHGCCVTVLRYFFGCIKEETHGRCFWYFPHNRSIKRTKLRSPPLCFVIYNDIHFQVSHRPITLLWSFWQSQVKRKTFPAVEPMLFRARSDLFLPFLCSHLPSLQTPQPLGPVYSFFLLVLYFLFSFAPSN